MTKCVMQMTFSERRHIKLPDITRELAISLGCVHNHLDCRKVCAWGNSWMATKLIVWDSHSCI